MFLFSLLLTSRIVEFIKRLPRLKDTLGLEARMRCWFIGIVFMYGCQWVCALAVQYMDGTLRLFCIECSFGDCPIWNLTQGRFPYPLW